MKFNDLYKLMTETFDNDCKIIEEGSGHGDTKIVTNALKDAYKRGLIDYVVTKKGWKVTSKNDPSKIEFIDRGERSFHYLRRFLQKIGS